MRKQEVFFFQAEDGIRDADVTGVQTCALPISEEFAFQVVDARRPPEEIQEALRACILPMLKEGRTKRISKAAAEKAAAEKVVAEKSAEKVSEKTSELTPVTEPVTTG